MLSNLVVLETGPGIAGPLVSRVFADLGARVIKVESRTRPDFQKARLLPPTKSRSDSLNDPAVLEMSGGKESVTLNLKSAEGRRLLLRLIAEADVYVENYAPGWLERIGLSLEQFRQLNPRLIILSQSAYGSEGPKRDQRAYAPLMTALAGVEGLSGYEDGEVVPQIVSAVGDVLAAWFGTLLVLSALYDRERDGVGVLLDMSQVEASTFLVGLAMAEYQLTGIVPRPKGNISDSAAPYGIYRTAGDDCWVALATYTDEQWAVLCRALDVDVATAIRFGSSSTRIGRREEVDSLIKPRIEKRGRDELWRELQDLGVPCTPVLDIYEVDDFPSYVERPLWTSFEHPDLNDLRMTEIPWRFEHVDLRRRAYAEPTGQSTEAVLTGLLGLSIEEVEDLRAVGALD